MPRSACSPRHCCSSCASCKVSRSAAKSAARRFYLTEHAPPGRRGIYTSVLQLMGPLGMLASTLQIVLLQQWLSEAEFREWGWRVPFIFSARAAGDLAEKPTQPARIADFPATAGEKRAGQSPVARMPARPPDAGADGLAVLLHLGGRLDPVLSPAQVYTNVFLKTVVKLPAADASAAGDDLDAGAAAGDHFLRLAVGPHRPPPGSTVRPDLGSADDFPGVPGPAPLRHPGHARPGHAAGAAAGPGRAAGGDYRAANGHLARAVSGAHPLQRRRTCRTICRPAGSAACRRSWSPGWVCTSATRSPVSAIRWRCWQLPVSSACSSCRKCATGRSTLEAAWHLKPAFHGRPAKKAVLFASRP